MVATVLRLIADELPLIPLYRRTLTWAMKKNVRVGAVAERHPRAALAARPAAALNRCPVRTDRPMTITRFSFPTTIHFGAGRAQARRPAPARARPEAAARRHRQGLAALPVLAEFAADLCAAGLDVAVFAGVFGNPTASQVDGRRRGVPGAPRRLRHRLRRRRRARRRQGRRRARHRTRATSIEYAWDHPQVRPIGETLPYFVALPTTSGTGTEVGRSSVISEDDTHVKRIVFSPKILAKAVFADPELTLGLPPARHRRHRHGRADAQRRELPVAGLPPAVRRHRARRHAHRRARAGARRCASRRNLAARSDMMMSSMMGAIAFQKDLGAVHSCAHALGTVCDLHHGLANALMIDTVLRLEPPRRSPAKFDELRACGAASSGGGGGLRRLADGAEAARSASPASLARGRRRARASIPRLVEIADGRHLPPDQSAAVTRGRFRARCSRRRCDAAP